MPAASSKRPASNMNMKRPAAATVSVNESVQNLKRGLEDEKEDTNEEEETTMKRPAAKASKKTNPKAEDQDDQKQGRDKGKGEKWARMRKDGLIPDYILNLYDEGSKVRFLLGTSELD